MPENPILFCVTPEGYVRVTSQTPSDLTQSWTMADQLRNSPACKTCDRRKNASDCGGVKSVGGTTGNLYTTDLGVRGTEVHIPCSLT